MPASGVVMHHNGDAVAYLKISLLCLACQLTSAEMSASLGFGVQWNGKPFYPKMNKRIKTQHISSMKHCF